MDPLLSIPSGVALTALSGLLLGGLALRLEGPYLSLIILTASLIMMSSTFGGEDGLTGVANLSNGPAVNYYTAFVLFVGVLLLCYLFTRTDTGDVLTGIREDEQAVIAAGLNPVKYKIFSFVFSAAVGGLAGTLLIHSMAGNATPNQLITLSVNIIAAAILGGMETIVGPPLEGLLFFMFQDSLRGPIFKFLS